MVINFLIFNIENYCKKMLKYIDLHQLIFSSNQIHVHEFVTNLVSVAVLNINHSKVSETNPQHFNFTKKKKKLNSVHGINVKTNL